MVTGFFLCGLICGPHGLDMLKNDSVDYLHGIEKVCLALIGISAGSELQLSDLRKRRREIGIMTLALTASSWLFTFVAFSLASPWGRILSSKVNPEHFSIISGLAATIMVARSPASAIAVVRELDAKGPFSSLSLTVIIVKDILVILLFSVNLGLAHRAFHSPQENVLYDLAATVFSIYLGMSVGALGAFIQIRLFLLHVPKLTVRSVEVSKAFKYASLVGVAASVFYACKFFQTEPLLGALMTGAAVMNLNFDQQKAVTEDFRDHLHRIMPMAHMAFFTVAGASVDLDALPSFVWTTLFIYSVRLLSLYAGCWAGNKLWDCPPEQRNVSWMAYVTQAGVAMGLAKSIYFHFPEWGKQFYTLMVSVIVLNQISGPPLFKIVLNILGEARKGMAPAPSDV